MGGEGGRRGERGKERGKKPKVEHKKYGCGFGRGIFLWEEKVGTKSYLIRYSGQKLAFRLLKLGKRKKLFLLVTLVESS